jgi:hypothetical protein
MSLNPQYIISPDLQQVLINKEDGLLMAGGLIYYYSDVNRTTPKAVYELTGSPPNYSFSPLPNPLTLSGIGTTQDANGNDVVVYLYPYDAEGNPELYYIQVYNAQGTFQWDRQGWPSGVAEPVPVDETALFNYIPNGQFLAHNNTAPTTTFNYGTFSATVYEVAPGGWTVETLSTTNSTNTINFFRFGSYTNNPPTSPRYGINVVSTSSSTSDDFKNICITFDDVNKFASDTESYTFSFTGKSNGADVPITINVLKYFGAGGSATIINPATVANNFTLTSNSQTFSIAILFGTNGSSTIGPNDDDFVQIQISLPTNVSSNTIITDAVLTDGNIVLTTFPTETNLDMLVRSAVGTMPLPNYNGLDAYLPIIMTPTGFQTDRSQVGKIFADTAAWSTSISATTNELLCDGSQYFTNNFSTLGIPFSRLQAVLYNSSLSLPIYGTGLNFATTNAMTGTETAGSIFFTTNQFGTSVAPADSVTIPTTFTFTPVYAGAAATNNVLCYSMGLATILLAETVVGHVTAPSAQTSNFTTFTTLKNLSSPSPNAYGLFSFVAVAGSAIGANNYFYFSSTTVDYYVWFAINGPGVDPARPGRTGIKVSILSTYSVADVANAVINAINGGVSSQIITVAGSSVAAGSWFTWSAPNGTAYYVWYSVGGAGADPKVASSTGIKVSILSTDTAVQVAAKTITAINSFAFRAPNLQGLVLRGYDPNVEWDIDAGTRFGLSGYGIYGNLLGTLELDQIVSHLHGINQSSASGTTGNQSVTTNNAISATPPTLVTGGTETRGVNGNVNWVIKY